MRGASGKAGKSILVAEFCEPAVLVLDFLLENREFGHPCEVISSGLGLQPEKVGFALHHLCGMGIVLACRGDGGDALLYCLNPDNDVVRRLMAIEMSLIMQS